MDNTRSNPGTNGSSNKDQRIKRKMDTSSRKENDKLSFLKNPITRPACYVGEDEDNNKEEQPAYSMATASKLANITPKTEDDDEEPKKSKFAKSNIDDDFKNMDDNITDQGQLKDTNYDHRSALDNSNDGDHMRESLTFKPGFLATKAQPDPSNTPMSFGQNMLGGLGRKNQDWNDDF